MNYSVLSEPGRHTSFGRGGNSDRSLVSGWYRFQSSSHTKMLDQCVSPRKCLTLLFGFLNGCIHSSRMALSTGRRVSMVILIAATEKLKLMWGNTMDFMLLLKSITFWIISPLCDIAEGTYSHRTTACKQHHCFCVRCNINFNSWAISMVY